MKRESFKKIKIPDKPGIYLFKKGDKILYIGKATSLRDRTKSYFAKDLIETRGQLITDMIVKASKIDWRETESVLEALILEAELIKKHQPYFNSREKDDRSFNYVCITKEKLPKVILVRGKNLDRSVFSACYGPFTNGGQLKVAMKIIRQIFPFLDDKNSNYIEFYRQINLVPDLDDRKMYLLNIRNIRLFFSGKKPQIFRNLKRQMKEYAKTREFEKAGEIKRQLFALKHINDVALIKKSELGHPMSKFGNFRIEAYDIAHMGGNNMVGVMTVVDDGQVDKNEYRKFKIRGQGSIRIDDTGNLREVLIRRLGHAEWSLPNLIVVDGGVAQFNLALSVLKERNLNIDVVSVVKDERHKPKSFIGKKEIIENNKNAILLGNSEAHRFAIAYHKNMRGKNFLK